MLDSCWLYWWCFMKTCLPSLFWSTDKSSALIWRTTAISRALSVFVTVPRWCTMLWVAELGLKARASLSTLTWTWEMVENVCDWYFCSFFHVPDKMFPETVKCENPLVVAAAERKNERTGLAELRVNSVAIIVMFKSSFLWDTNTIHPVDWGGEQRRIEKVLFQTCTFSMGLYWMRRMWRSTCEGSSGAKSKNVALKILSKQANKTHSATGIPCKMPAHGEDMEIYQYSKHTTPGSYLVWGILEPYQGFHENRTEKKSHLVWCCNYILTDTMFYNLCISPFSLILLTVLTYLFHRFFYFDEGAICFCSTHSTLVSVCCQL